MKFPSPPRQLKFPQSRSETWRSTRENGFSLLEVLVSIIILSFGLLGMVGLQAAALQATRDARLQTSAISLARELAEMMRGNKDVGLAASSNPYIGDFTPPLTPTTASYCLNVGSGTACANNTAIANAQMTEWLGRVKSELPGARVSICLDSAPFDSGGLPKWACTSSGTDATTVIKMGWTRASTDRSATGAAALDRALVPSVVLPITPGNSL